jgi:hypothetical protein
MALQNQDIVKGTEEQSSSGGKGSGGRKRSRFTTRGESRKEKKPESKEYVFGGAKYPSQKSAEVAILAILGRSSSRSSGVRTSQVLKELKENFFKELSSSDLKALYPISRKNVVDSALKFAKKNLVQKGDVLPPGSSGYPVGVWRICEKGISRLEKEMEGWEPKYVVRYGLLVEV